ncbi:MAG: T9SS type A sorting domain-containing protein [Saprospiraceae bacterium]|nr:T9SS type A sorting domain-containing protein [Saprospiraceae bacterium]
MAASHPYNVSIDAEGLMEVRFENINLPDSTTNYTGSQGFFMYEIKPRDALPIGSIVTNSAGIYFDFNPPVLTNEVKNLIGYELDVVIMANGSILCDSNALLLNAAIHTTLDSFSYHWEKDGVWVSGDSTLAVNETGQYVIVVNSYGVILTDTIVITQTNDLIASFSTGIDGNEISFFNESVGADSSFWDFGNGQTSNNDSPQLTLLTGVGSLYVCLTVVNTCGTHQNCQHIILSGTAPNAGQMEVLSISPNPTKGLVSLRLALSKEAEIQLSLFDMQGRHAGFDRTLFYTKGMEDVLIDLDSHPAGVYLLRIQVGDTVVWRKIVHQ